MRNERELTIDGKRVVFRIGRSTQAMAVPDGDARTDLPPEMPFLSVHVGPPEKPEWSGILLNFSTLIDPSISDFTDDDLSRLYVDRAEPSD